MANSRFCESASMAMPLSRTLIRTRSFRISVNTSTPGGGPGGTTFTALPRRRARRHEFHVIVEQVGQALGEGGIVPYHRLQRMPHLDCAWRLQLRALAQN